MRLSLGTVQLGVAYGVNNSVGALSDEQVEAVLEAAVDSGFTMVDTSIDYGLAIERIGRFLRRRPESFEVVGKFYGALSANQIRTLKEQCAPLIDFDYTLLWTHAGGQDIASLDPSLADGVTVYTVEEAEAVNPAFGMVQVPASVLDGRMDAEIVKLQASGAQVLVRSLLLQGLIASDPDVGPVGHHRCPELPELARPYLKRLRILADLYAMDVVELAVRWVWEIGPDVAIVGAETPEQARAIGEAWQRGPLPGSLTDRLRELRVGIPEVVISPIMWDQHYDFTVTEPDES